MALHRKQRGPADVLPQYVRLPAARASPSPVASATTRHPRKPRARLLRDVYPAPRQQISSLQLRACFLLCVLLYFGTIYFADNIVSLGQALSSDQPRSNHDFFVQSEVGVKADVAAHMRIAVSEDDRGGEEENKALKEEEEEATEQNEAAQNEQDERRDDEEEPREAQADAQLPALHEQQQDTKVNTEKADEPDSTKPVEELVPVKMTKRNDEAGARLVEHFPAPMGPPRVVRDAATDRERAHSAAVRINESSPETDAHEAVAAANAPARVTEPADKGDAVAPQEQEAEKAAVETEVKDGDAAKALRRVAPPDEPAQEEKPHPEGQEEPADAAPHEEHR